MKPPTVLETARLLTAQRHKLLPTYPLDHDGSCTCPAKAACRSPGKHPHGVLAPRGYHDATDQPRVVERWLSAEPQAGLALAAASSGLVVLDFDPRNGGADTLAALRQADAAFATALDTTVQVRSQGGGWHYYFDAAPDLRYPASLGSGADVKHKGLVMLPPTRGVQGQYMWAAGRSIFDCQPLPAASIERVLRPRAAPLARAQKFAEQPNAAAMRDLRNALMVLDHNDRPTWIKVGYALWTAGELGEQLWFDWSRRSPKYDERDACETWDSIANSDSHWRAVFTYAQEAADAWIARLKTKRK